MISIIVAVAQGGVIGGENRLLWHISEDLRHFKSITSGHPVIMGRKTFESLGRPLPNRENVVITRSEIEIEGCRVAHSLEEALSPYSPAESLFIIGGAQIYGEAMAIADRFYLTRVEREYEGDTYFPEWVEAEWERVKCERWERGERFDAPFIFEEYRRVAHSGCDYHIAQATRDDAATINDIATDSFRATYTPIVPAEQIEWMFEDMYSIESIQLRQFDKGQLFFLLYHHGAAVGYVSLEREGTNLVHLHKLYLRPAMQGLGYGRRLIEYAFARAKQMCGGAPCRLELDVNRGNRAVEFYFRLGMQIARQGDYKIEGTEYIRPDYILYINL